MVTAKRARTAETLKQPSPHLRSARLGSIPTDLCGTVNPRHGLSERVGVGNPPLRVRASYFYPTSTLQKSRMSPFLLSNITQSVEPLGEGFGLAYFQHKAFGEAASGLTSSVTGCSYTTIDHKS
jgi:hypothetical protein